jgi:aldose 1-epimerase
MNVFGKLPNNQDVHAYTLRNKNGCELTVINYGATITSLKIPTDTTNKVDVVLGFDSLEAYCNSYDLPSAPYFGAVIGRYAGRINEASFTLNSKNINLTTNHKTHQLHGGNEGFSQKIWRVIQQTTEDNPSITLEYYSEALEENYPGAVTVKVTYTLTENNELKVGFWAKSSEDTIINLTQHSYFNLNGHCSSVENLKLQVHSKNIVETTNELIPTGKFTDLQNHAFDFSTFKDCPTHIDTTFVLEDNRAAVLYSESSNLQMTVTTTQPAVHIYVGGNCFDTILGKEHAKYHPLSGICFETQNFPDAPNHSHFPNAILKKDEIYTHETVFQFESITL